MAHAMLQTVHQARIEQANGSGRAVTEERVLPDHKASLREKDAELQVTSPACAQATRASVYPTHISPAKHHLIKNLMPEPTTRVYIFDCGHSQMLLPTCAYLCEMSVHAA